VQTKKARGRMETTAQLIITSGLDGGQQSASRPGRFAPRRNRWGSHYTGGLMGSKADPDADKTHVSCFCRVSKQGSSMFSSKV